MRPRWLFGTFLRTLAKHGMPHFENSYAERGVAMLSRGVAREFGERGHLDWTHVARIRKRWTGKLVVKGILHPDDGRIAREHGADAVIVSNHGGRQLDGAVSALRVLPDVVASVPGHARHLSTAASVAAPTCSRQSRSARASCSSRGRSTTPRRLPATQALRHAIALLASEIDRDMAMLGINRVGELGPAYLHRMAGYFPLAPADPVSARSASR